MASEATLHDLDDQIGLVRRNIQELMEQATAASGAASEERLSALINDQQAKLDELLARRRELGGDA